MEPSPDALGIASLERKLAHVLEVAIRRALLVEWLEALGADAYPAVAAVLCRDRPDDVLRRSLCEVLGAGLRSVGSEPGPVTQLSYELQRDLYAAAAVAGNEEVMRFLRSAAPRAAAENPNRLMNRELAEIPLGRRRTLAKGPDPVLLEQLARDPDSVVIRNLLRNPRLVEADVLRMAALRPVAASTLLEVARSARWATRPRIRTALARNPYSPIDVAVEMVATLPLAELREMRHDPDLHAETRAQVESELGRVSRP